MAIDTTPSTVATNALDALDFSALIGGPMDAIIKAQALAAQTTYEFINEVGLTVDPDTGEKKPVNVSFQYNNNGQLTTLTVPLLVILTIPNIEVSSFVIDFIANISASSSSTEETSTDTELGIDAEAEATLKVGPFSLRVKAKANYSSKQHSKAAQESKYSVEYTMNVRVEGGQSGMPAGLQTVLNILQGSNTSVSPDEMVALSPAFIDMDGVTRATLGVVVKNAQGYLAAGTLVTLNLGSDSPFSAINVVKGHQVGDVSSASGDNFSVSEFSRTRKLARANNPDQIISNRVLKPFNRRFNDSASNFVQVVDPTTGNITEESGVTDSSGTVVFELILSSEITDDQQGTIAVTAYIPVSDAEGQESTSPEIQSVPYAILVPTQQQGSLVLTGSPNPIALDSSTLSQAVTVSVADAEATAVEGEDVVFLIEDSSGEEPTGIFDNLTGTATSDASGETAFTVKLSAAPTSADTYTLVVTNNSATTLRIPINVTV